MTLAIVPAVLRALDQEGIEPARFALREPSLDDVFLTLTGRAASPDGGEPGGGEPGGGERHRRRRSPR